MKKGIIYRAFNKINEKSYIGQTIVSLATRKSRHYGDAELKNSNYKFARALRKYKKEDWEWIILEEANYLDLDNLEINYITKFDSFKNGYNSNLGGKGEYHHKYNKTIYELYHEKYGIVKGTIHQLAEINPNLYGCQNLVAGRNKHIGGYVLLKNKENYDELVGIYNFYHPDYGIVRSSASDLTIRLNNKVNVSCLITKNTKYLRQHIGGWILAKYKDNYQEIIDKDKCILTMWHEDYGIRTLRASEFIKQFNLHTSELCLLSQGKRKTHKGWSVIKDKPNFHR